MLHHEAAPSQSNPRTVVLLCGSLMNLGTGLNLEELRLSLEDSFPGTTVEVIPDLCEHPARLSSVAACQSATRAVLGLCSGDYSQIELQSRARKAGLDPLGLEIVPLGALCAGVHPEPQATRKARILLSAAIARAHAFAGSGPEHTKLCFLSRDQKVTRRSLFTVPPIEYRPVPAIRGERCAAETGCHLCVKVCPRDALRKAEGHLFLDKARCEGCGVCLTVCPREAIDLPGWSIPQFEAQITTLLDSVKSASEPFGLLFTCQKAFGKLEELARWGVSYCHQWLPVVVPCLGMVTPSWLLQALAHGAEAVVLLSCNADCPIGQQRAIGGRVNYCRRLLRGLHQAPERVRVLSTSHPERLLRTLQEPPPHRGNGCQSQSEEPVHLDALKGAFEAIRCLAGDDYPSPKVVLEHPHSPFGVLELRAEGCTGCLACVEACPTGALASERSSDEVTVTYVASSCSGCKMCVDVCPETAAQVLRVHSVTDLDTLSRGKVVLHKNRLTICQGCGASIVSQALLRRIEASLEVDNEALHTTLSHYCPSCRLSFAWGTKPPYTQQG